jgi:hypothetical protein
MMSQAWEEIDQATARRLLALAPRLPFEQGWAHAQAMAATGMAAMRFLALGEEAVATICERRWWGLWPVRECLRGPVWIRPPGSGGSTDAAMDGFMRMAFRRHPFAMSFWTTDLADAHHADAVARRAGMRRVMTGHATAIVPVLADPLAQRARLHGKWRNALAAAEARGRLRAHATRERRAVVEVVERYEGLRRARGFAGPPGRMLAAMATLEDPGRVFAVVAERGAATAAAGLFFVHGDEATWVAGFSTPDGLKEGGHRLVLMAALAELRRMGVARLDLGGVATDGAPGITRFKLGLGGSLAVLPGTWGR